MLELLTERRARAAAMSGYALAGAEWISGLMDRDRGAQYFAFDLWSTAPWGRDDVLLARAIRRACGATACDLFPTLNPNSMNRLPLAMSVGAVLVPAQKEFGVLHAHGFLRIPTVKLTDPLVNLKVDTNGQTVVIERPVAVKFFAQHLRQSSGRSSSSLHVAHDDGVPPKAINVAVNRERRAQKLAYLTDAGPEVRSWDGLDFVPGRFWKRLVKGMPETSTEANEVLV